MSRRDLFLVASAAAISSLLTYLTCANVATRPEAPRHEIGAASGNHEAPQSHADDDTAHAATGKQGSDAVTASQRASSQIVSASHSDKDASQDPALVFRQRQELGERFSGLFKNGSNPDSGALGARIENRFYLEEWNQEWAGSKESNIRTLFEHNENLSGVVPLQVTCRSENCQVVLSASSQDQVRLLSQQFMQAASRGDLGMKNKVVSFFPDVSMGRMVFYLSDNGNSDLFK